MPQHSAWMDIGPKHDFLPLKKNLETRVAIIGGGLTGLLTAYVLSDAGLEISIFESGRIGSGVTSYTTAFATQAIDTSVAELISIYGVKKASLVWQSGGEAIDLLESIIKKEKIDCEWERSSVHIYADDSKGFNVLKKEADAIAKVGSAAGLHESGKLGFKHSGYLEIKNQAKFHPLKFVFALADILQKRGVSIYEETKIQSVSGRGPVTLKSRNTSIQADWSIMATYRPLDGQSATRFKKAMYKSYVLEAQIPSGSIKSGMYLDLQNPYHYFRVDRVVGDQDRLIFGGEDHRMDIKVSPRKNNRALETHMKKILGAIPFTITNRWDGPILEPIDALPLIGQMKPHQLVATAFSGNGMTFAGVSALLLRDSILGKKNAWTKLYHPKRFLGLKSMIYKGRDFTLEFLGGAVKNTFTG